MNLIVFGDFSNNLIYNESVNSKTCRLVKKNIHKNGIRYYIKSDLCFYKNK